MIRALAAIFFPAVPMITAAAACHYIYLAFKHPQRVTKTINELGETAWDKMKFYSYGFAVLIGTGSMLYYAARGLFSWMPNSSAASYADTAAFFAAFYGAVSFLAGVDGVARKLAVLEDITDRERTRDHLAQKFADNLNRNARDGTMTS